MEDPRSDRERELSGELDAARKTIETALAHLHLPAGRKRAITILEDGKQRHGHSTGYRLRHPNK